MSWDTDKLKNILEGALMAANKTLSIDGCGELFDEDERPSKAEIQQALDSLVQDYEHRGVVLKQVSSGYRFQVRQEYAPWVGRLWDEKPPRYSRALMETLALIAYQQPITRGDIESIRGVAVSSNIIKTLQEREWVRVVGHKDVPGRPAMYATTRVFLDYFDLQNLDELPSLAEVRDLDKVNEELKLEDSSESAAPAAAESGEAAEDQQDEGAGPVLQVVEGSLDDAIDEGVNLDQGSNPSETEIDQDQDTDKESSDQAFAISIGLDVEETSAEALSPALDASAEKSQDLVAQALEQTEETEAEVEVEVEVETESFPDQVNSVAEIVAVTESSDNNVMDNPEEPRPEIETEISSTEDAEVD